jgi:hypothetical protein
LYTKQKIKKGKKKKKKIKKRVLPAIPEVNIHTKFLAMQSFSFLLASGMNLPDTPFDMVELRYSKLLMLEVH